MSPCGSTSSWIGTVETIGAMSWWPASLWRCPCQALRKVKLPDYRAIPSVREIVLIDQQQLYCEAHRRLDNGRWLVDLLRRPEARLQLESIGFDQPLSAIYDHVVFEVLEES